MSLPATLRPWSSGGVAPVGGASGLAPLILYVSPRMEDITAMKSNRKPAPSAAAAAAPATMQPLEHRVLLAGHITAVVRGGILNITGDAQGNEFTIAPGTGANSIKITAAAGTTINKGRTEITLSGVTSSVRINTGGGNDIVRVEGATVARGLSIETADGNDRVFLTNTNVTERLFISTGAGNDTLNTSAGRVSLTTEIHMGAGNDIVELSGTDFQKRFSAKLGAGNDSFLPGNATFKREQRFVDGQRGSDAILSGEDLDDLTFNFANSNTTRGWEFGIADYDRPDQDNLERRGELRNLPSEINSAQKGLFLSSKNLSDDVFQFVKRQITGLNRNTDYVARFSVTFATNTPTGMIALGGRPADDVHLKVGGSTAEPTAETRKGGRVRVNLDKGSDNDTSGRDMTVISTAGNGVNVTGAGSSQTFRSVTRTGYHANPIRTDANGNLWLAIGTDSDFPDTTGIFIQSISVTLVPLG